MVRDPRKLSKRALTMLRAAKTSSECKYSIGGTEKAQKDKPKPASLPTLKFLQDDEGLEGE